MLKKIIAIILCAGVMSTAVSAASFSDVEGHWAESEIQYGVDNGMIDGYNDGTFKPNNPITRAEFVKMLTASICENLKLDPAEYGDETHWASAYYNFAMEKGISVPRTEDIFDDVLMGSFDATSANYQIKRWEMAYMLYCVLSNVFRYDVLFKDYTDHELTVQTYNDEIAYMIGSCIYAGLLNGDQNGNFNASRNGTRAEATAIVNRVDRKIKAVLEQNNVSAENDGEY